MSRRATLEAMGERKVRLLLQPGKLYFDLVDDAAEWLAELDEAERLRMSASQTMQERTAITAKNVAIIAAVAAIVANVITIIGIAASAYMWLHPVTPTPQTTPKPAGSVRAAVRG